MVAMVAENSLLGRNVKIFFDDGNKVVFKIGILRKIDNSYIEILNGDNEIEVISSMKFVRMEVLTGEK